MIHKASEIIKLFPPVAVDPADDPYHHLRSRPAKKFRFVGGSKHNQVEMVSGSFQDGYGLIGESGLPGQALVEDYRPDMMTPGVMYLRSSNLFTYRDFAEVN